MAEGVRSLFDTSLDLLICHLPDEKLKQLKELIANELGQRSKRRIQAEFDSKVNQLTEYFDSRPLKDNRWTYQIKVGWGEYDYATNQSSHKYIIKWYKNGVPTHMVTFKVNQGDKSVSLSAGVRLGDTFCGNANTMQWVRYNYPFPDDKSNMIPELTEMFKLDDYEWWTCYFWPPHRLEQLLEKCNII